MLQLATGQMFFGRPGQLIRVATDGARTVVLDGLDRPTSVGVGPDEAVYVTQGIPVDMGEVLRVEPSHPCAESRSS